MQRRPAARQPWSIVSSHLGSLPSLWAVSYCFSVSHRGGRLAKRWPLSRVQLSLSRVQLSLSVAGCSTNWPNGRRRAAEASSTGGCAGNRLSKWGGNIAGRRCLKRWTRVSDVCWVCCCARTSAKKYTKRKKVPISLSLSPRLVLEPKFGLVLGSVAHGIRNENFQIDMQTGRNFSLPTKAHCV